MKRMWCQTQQYRDKEILLPVPPPRQCSPAVPGGIPAKPGHPPAPEAQECPRKLAVFQAAPALHLKFVPLEIRGWNEATDKVHNAA